MSALVSIRRWGRGWALLSSPSLLEGGRVVIITAAIAAGGLVVLAIAAVPGSRPGRQGWGATGHR